MFDKHPKGLPVLFFTELWERFGFYLMLGIFFLYMIDGQQGGLGMDSAEAATIMGNYLALVYLTPFVGGMLAERVLGFRKSIIIGGLFMAAGYLLLAYQNMAAFWGALALIVIGNGLFKPNISALVGNLYNDERYRPHKDAGFSIFYMGINVGAFFSNFVASIVRNNDGWWGGWGPAFATAGIGMLVGVIWFAMGQQHTKEADILRPPKDGEPGTAKVLGVVLAPAAAFGALGYSIHLVLGTPLIKDPTNDAFIFASLPIAYYYFNLWRTAEPHEKGPIAALLSIMGVVIVFWAVFHQNSTALTNWAEKYTDRSMPGAVEPAAESLYLVQRVDATPREVTKADSHGVTLRDADGNALKELGPHPYFNNVPQEAWPQVTDQACDAGASDTCGDGLSCVSGPDGKSGVCAERRSLISAELFQSVNAGLIVVFTPLVVAAFGFLAARRREPSTPGKIALGLLITGLSTLVMVGAVWASDNLAIKVSSMWLVASYAVVTVGELCLSPMGLALVSKLSPPRMTALMMGGWFLSTAIGNKLSGLLASLWDVYDDKANFFIVNFSMCLAAAAAIFFMLPWLKRVMREALGEE